MNDSDIDDLFPVDDEVVLVDSENPDDPYIAHWLETGETLLRFFRIEIREPFRHLDEKPPLNELN
ncbi:MAG: hypothetical protein KBC47_03590 [Candidatus Peribacteraceae bacterium]|nr:hypothetical protein [Candidatus Peribacteraceae bacterium]